MKLGFALPQAGAWATPEHQLALARRAEELGYASLWTFQRLLYVMSPRDPYPGGNEDGRWPAIFERVLDPLVSLAFVASATSRARLGVAVLNLPYHRPVMLAKALATLDVLSGGRLDVGVGLGWSSDEFEAVGAPFAGRGRQVDEMIAALKALWSDGVVELPGPGGRVPPSLTSPRPVQRPHPPLLIGGYAPAAVRRTVSVGDGFLSGNPPLERVGPLIELLWEAARAAGRDPDSLRAVARGMVRVHGKAQGPDRRPLWGSLDEVAEDVGRYERAGLTELFLDLNFDPRIAGPQADPQASFAGALELLEALAPGPPAGSAAGSASPGPAR